MNLKPISESWASIVVHLGKMPLVQRFDPEVRPVEEWPRELRNRRLYTRTVEAVRSPQQGLHKAFEMSQHWMSDQQLVEFLGKNQNEK